MNIDGFELVKTCSACPEQYDVFLNNKQVGYLRLRHGYFSCDFLCGDGEEVYSADTIGNGMFEDEERDFHLKLAINAIKLRLDKYKDANVLEGETNE